MTCDDVDAIIEDIAAGDESPAVSAHIASCARCSVSLANARAIEQMLTTLRPDTPPADFSRQVMARVRRDRWRSEQVFDWSFNIAVALGVLLITVGLGGIAWSMGLISIGSDLMTVLSQDAPRLLNRVAAESQTVVLAGLLLTAAFGLWWYTENDSFI